MQSITPISSLSQSLATPPKAPTGGETAEAFQGFVGETFFGMMLKSLRQTSKEVAYIDGGQAEKMFRQQLDQHIAEHLTETHGRDLAAPLFEQFESRRSLTSVDALV